MRLRHDPFKDELMVKNRTLRQFYIDVRKESGITIGKLENDCGLRTGSLRVLEKPHTANKRLSNSTKNILIALEVLGYALDISE